MKFAIPFFLVGVSLAWEGVRIGRWGYLLTWMGLSVIAVGLAYAAMWPHVFGKRSNGSLSPVRVTLLLPYLLPAWGVWHIRRWVTSTPSAHEVAPGIWLGRRPYWRELPPGVALVVDLTAEFPMDRKLAGKVEYLCEPVLDAGVTNDRALANLVAKIAAEARPVYLHCAIGFGRSATLAAAVLIRKGLADDVESAIVYLRKTRRGVWLNGMQRRQVMRVARGEEAKKANTLLPQMGTDGHR